MLFLSGNESPRLGDRASLVEPNDLRAGDVRPSL
jgi:hypothetical protein